MILLNFLSLFLLSTFFLITVNGDCSSLGALATDHKDNSYNWDPNNKDSSVQYSICSTINGVCGADNNAANQCFGKATGCCGVCQRWSNKDGSQDGACLGTTLGTVDVKGGDVEITYTNGDVVGDTGVGRSVIITIQCGSTDLLPISFTNQPPTPPPGQPYVYNLVLQSNKACGLVGKLGLGSILLIVFFNVVMTYVAVGFVWNFFKNKRRGIELVPNLEFWQLVPTNFIAGVFFVKEKVSSLVNRGSYDQVG